MNSPAEVPWFSLNIDSVGQLPPVAAGEAVWSDMPNFRRGGEWPAATFRTVACATGRVAVVGHCLASDETIENDVTQAYQSGTFTGGRWPGSYATFIFGADSGPVIQADLAGQFAVFYDSQNGRTQVGSHSSMLSQAHGGKPDLITLAASIGCPETIELTVGRSAFEGVQRLEGGEELRVGPNGVRMGTGQDILPDPSATLDDAAEALRTALMEGLRLRAELGQSLTGDLSGGMDSSLLAYLLARYRPGLPVFTYNDPRFPTNDMERVQAYLALPQSKALRWQEFRMPEGQEGLKRLRGLTVSEEPDVAVTGDGTYGAYLEFLRDAGSEIHITGRGGDEVAGLVPAYLADLARLGSHRQLWRAARDLARLNHKSPLSAVRWAHQGGRTSLAGAFRQFAADLAQPDPFVLPRRHTLSWISPVGASAGWLTPQARYELAELALSRATDASIPEGLDIGNYAVLGSIRAAGRDQHQSRQTAYGQYGISLHAPFYDDDVLKAAFSIPGYLRMNPWVFKQILRRALDGVVPAMVLERHTKGDYSGARYQSLRNSVADFRRLIGHDSRLADLGIINPQAVRTALDQMASGGSVPGGALDRLVASEVWLRNLGNDSHSWQPLGGRSPALPLAETPVNHTLNGSTLRPGDRYRLPRHIYVTWFGSGKGMTTFNYKTGAYHNLDPVATTMLEAVSSAGSVESALGLLTSNFPCTDQEQQQLRDKLKRCVQKLADQGIITKSDGVSLGQLLETRDAEPVTTGTTMVRVAEQTDGLRRRDYAFTAGALALTAVLKHLPFPATPRVLRALHAVWRPQPASQEQTKRTLVAARRVSDALFLSKVACRELSMATALAMALQRRKVTLVIGAATDPNRTHAWIEADGQPVTLADDELTAAYQPLLRI